MLLSEFIDRTGVNLNGIEYAEIEKIYVESSLDKDAWCEGWKRTRNDAFVQDCFDIIRTLLNRVELETNIGKQLDAEIDRMKTAHEKELKTLSESCTEQSQEFAKRIIRHLSSELPYTIWQEIEQEYGFGFIIKSKREMGIALSEQEIDYLISKI